MEARAKRYRELTPWNAPHLSRAWPKPGYRSLHSPLLTQQLVQIRPQTPARFADNLPPRPAAEQGRKKYDGNLRLRTGDDGSYRGRRSFARPIRAHGTGLGVGAALLRQFRPGRARRRRSTRAAHIRS